MSDPLLPREVRRRLAIIQHAEEVTGNVAMTCRYYGVSRPTTHRLFSKPTSGQPSNTATVSYSQHGFNGSFAIPTTRCCRSWRAGHR